MCITHLLDESSATESAIGDESLDLGGLLSLLSILGGPSAANDVLLHESDSVILLETEQSAETSESLGAETAGDVHVGHSWELGITLLHNRESEDSDVLSDDAASDGLSLSLTSAAWAVPLLILAHQDLASTLPLAITPIPLTRIPCLMGKPCLSFPPVILTT